MLDASVEVLMKHAFRLARRGREYHLSSTSQLVLQLQRRDAGRLTEPARRQGRLPQLDTSLIADQAQLVPLPCMQGRRNLAARFPDLQPDATALYHDGQQLVCLDAEHRLLLIVQQPR